MKDSQCGGCGCSGGRKTRKIRRGVRGGQPKETLKEMAERMAKEEKDKATKPATIAELAKKIKERQDALKGKGKKVGGTVVGDALLAGTALGLYSYFTRKRGGQKIPKRKTKKELV